MPRYERKAQISVTIINGIIPSYSTRKGRFRQPVPSAEASIAKIDP